MVDPYLDADIAYENGVKVMKAELPDLNERFDLVLMNYVFEHLPNPQKR